MKTEILRGNRPKALARAVEILSRGELVAFATETVYGLGADARSDAAVAKIFAAKGRPAHNPLIAHVLDARMAEQYVRWNDRADALAEKLWPGPLTLVLPRKLGIADAVAAGGKTLAVRAPAHVVSRALLGHFEAPLAAPSANRSNAVSPTTAEHVKAELDGRVELILDGGPCLVGLESTVLDLTGPTPTILRPGAITSSQIAAIIGCAVALGPQHGQPTERGADAASDPTTSPELPRSPGQLPRHYSPTRPVTLFTGGDQATQSAPSAVGPDDDVLAHSFEPVRGIRLPNEPEGYARGLYAALRALDQGTAGRIWIEAPPTDGDERWIAIRDRLRRACHVDDR